MIWGIDAGNFNGKVVNEEIAEIYRSCLGEWRERNLKSSFGSDDMEWEYQGEKGFAGTLAQYESEFPREMMGGTKAHEDAKLRVLLALHRYSGKDLEHDIVVGQPIDAHNEEEKNKIKRMLKGQHTIKVNGITKTFYIRRVEVAAEGGAIYWATRFNASLVRIIDIGSGTVNCATIIEGKYIDRDSFTLPFGANSTKTNDLTKLGRGVIAGTSGKWNAHDTVFIAGGVAKDIEEVIQTHYPTAKALPIPKLINGSIEILHPVFANATAFYNIAKEIYK
jgi:plasmid segregation protein ParM